MELRAHQRFDPPRLLSRTGPCRGKNKITQDVSTNVSTEASQTVFTIKRSHDNQIGAVFVVANEAFKMDLHGTFLKPQMPVSIRSVPEVQVARESNLECEIVLADYWTKLECLEIVLVRLQVRIRPDSQ